MNIKRINEALLLEGVDVDSQEIMDVLEIIFGIKDAQTPEELMVWNARVQPLFQEMLEEAFGRLVQKSRLVRTDRLREALVILQGGQ